jgi:lactate dehydrogenase-like 2-hydroxyacid dehydrogenase
MKKRSKIYVTRQIPQAAFDVLLEECNVSFWNSVEPVPRGEFLNNIRGVDAVFCMPTDKVDSVVLDRAGKIIYLIIFIDLFHFSMDRIYTQQAKQLMIGFTLTNQIALN